MQGTLRPRLYIARNRRVYDVDVFGEPIDNPPERRGVIERSGQLQAVVKYVLVQ